MKLYTQNSHFFKVETAILAASSKLLAVIILKSEC